MIMILGFNSATNIFHKKEYLFVLAFIRYAGRATRHWLRTHLNFDGETLRQILDLLVEAGFVRVDYDYYELTDEGHRFIETIGLSSLKVSPENPEIALFKSQWSGAIAWAAKSRLEMFSRTGVMKNCCETFYYKWAREFDVMRKLKVMAKRHLYDWMSPEEKALWDHPFRESLFRVWQETTGGVRKGWRVEVNERMDFFEYLYDRLDVAYNPEHGNTYQNFKDMVFSLGMLRPNNQNHIHISYSFEQRPLKAYIREYLNMAVITGQYDILMRRYPPYHNMLNMNAAPGDRIAFDMRGFDFRPITFALDQRFTFAIELSNVPLRSNDRYLICPALNDKRKELEKKAEIAKMQKELDGIFPSMKYLRDIGFDNEGNVRLITENGELGEKIDMYGIKRAQYLQKQDQANIKKGIPTPARESGLVIHFFFREPVAALLEGIAGKRPFSIKDIKYLIKILDMAMAESNQASPDYNAVIDTFFKNPEVTVKSAELSELLEAIEDMEDDKIPEPDIHKYISDRLLEGKCKLLLQSLCNRLMSDGFNLVFSLWPLITGKEFPIDDPEASYDEKLHQREVVQMPLIDNLKRELEEMLSNIFNKHIDISAATVLFRSESHLAGMIVKHCLNVKADEATFKNQLKWFLRNHYSVHFNFLVPYYAGEGKCSAILETILSYQVNIEENIERDINGMLECVRNTRKRLFSAQNNNRLLYFIDPDSVDVQIGKFQFGGKSLIAEHKFILNHIRNRGSVALESDQSRHLLESLSVSLNRMEIEAHKKRATGKAIAEGEIQKLRVREQLETARKKSEIRLQEMELHKEARQVNLELVKKLKDGKPEDAAFIVIMDAFQKGGPGEVERLFRDSPEILMVLRPELFQIREDIELKRKLMEILKENPQLGASVLMATLCNFGSSLGELVEKFAKFFKN